MIKTVLALILIWLGCSPATLFAQRNAHEPRPAPMRLPPPDPNAPRWHTITVKPKPSHPEIHFYDKFNPIWWFGNEDDPTPPAWYKPDDKRRNTKWYFRNPFHNFNFYVIGVADKKFSRSGKFPERNSDPRGGWDFAVTRRHVLLLPYFSYERSWCNFYLGWRERGNFGIKLNFPAQKRPAEKSMPQKMPPGSLNPDQPFAVPQIRFN